MANVVQQRGRKHRAQIGRVARYRSRAPVLRAERTQRTQHQIVDAEAMLEARVGCSRPDTIDKSKLLDALKPDELRCTDQIEFQRAKRDEVVEAIANGRLRLIVRQRGDGKRRGIP